MHIIRQPKHTHTRTQIQPQIHMLKLRYSYSDPPHRWPCPKLHSVGNSCFFSCLRHFLICTHTHIHIQLHLCICMCVCGCVCICACTQVVIMNDLLFYNKHAERRRSRRRCYDVCWGPGPQDNFFCWPLRRCP